MPTDGGVIYEPRYRNLAVHAGPEHGLRTVILDRLYERYGYMIEHKSAFLILQLRIMPMPGNGCFGDNSTFREFCATFPEYLMQQGIESHHVWVRRHPGFASGHHYIVVMLLDAERSDCFHQHLPPVRQTLVGGTWKGLVAGAHQFRSGKRCRLARCPCAGRSQGQPGVPPGLQGLLPVPLAHRAHEPDRQDARLQPRVRLLPAVRALRTGTDRRPSRREYFSTFHDHDIRTTARATQTNARS